MAKDPQEIEAGGGGRRGKRGSRGQRREHRGGAASLGTGGAGLLKLDGRVGGPPWEPPGGAGPTDPGPGFQPDRKSVV